MQKEELDESLLEIVKALQEKYNAVGEDLTAHLEGMLFSYYENYWDYVGIDALLNLQKPKTKYEDEMIFIVYHQITELYFKIIIHELELIGYNENLDVHFFIKKLNRINKYFQHLTNSFDVLISGIEEKQFLSFRKALIPASGFQSIQYRLIELWATQFINLVAKSERDRFTEKARIKEMYEFLYWKQGATDRKTGKKTLTLVQFEERYGNLILRKGKEFKKINLLSRYKELPLLDRKNEELISALKQFDLHANVNWPLAHYRYAVRYLQKGQRIEKSTGGTNWKQYLPPKFQKQIFYPGLWTVEEIDNWGRTWVESVLLDKSNN